MKTYDSTVDENMNTTQERIEQAVEPVRKRPIVSSAIALAVAAVAAAGVFGGRKYAQSRRPRSRWQQMVARFR